MSTTVQYSSFGAALAPLMLIGSAASSLEKTGNASADALLEFLERPELEITVEAVTGTESDFEITGLSVQNNEDDYPLHVFEKIVFTDAFVTEEGRLGAGIAKFENYHSDGVTISELRGEDVLFPSPEDIENSLLLPKLDSTFELTNLVISDFGAEFGNDVTVPSDVDDTPSLKINRAYFSIPELTNGHPSEVKAQLEFEVETETLDSLSAQALWAMLGYETLNVSTEMSGAWDASTKTIQINSNLSIDDVANLDYDITLGEATETLIENAYKAKDIQTAIYSVLAPTLTVESAGVHFENSSIVDRSIDIYASMTGATREAAVEELISFVSVFSSEIKGEELRNEFQVGLASFLKDPNSLSIELSSNTPITVQQAMTDDPEVYEQFNANLQVNGS